MDNFFNGIGKLGFGLMRLPQKGGKTDIEQVKKMVDLFMDAGYTYYDTAWAYAGSEEAIREALVERYPRESYQIATKNALWIGTGDEAEMVRQFETSVQRLGIDYIDYYLLHNLGNNRTKAFEDAKAWDFVRELKEKGLIRHYGFSHHGTADELEDILTKHPDAEFVQLQINYADWNDKSVQAAKCYEIATKHGKPVIVMEPVKGGILANVPESVGKVFEESSKNLSPAGWAIRFAADLDNVAVVLSGMSNIEQMEDNLSTMKGFSHLDDDDKRTLEYAKAEFDKFDTIPCTACEYCSKVCPKNIGVSNALNALNVLTMYGDKEAALRRLQWNGFYKTEGPEKCIKCGKCEKACPQHIEIVKWLDKATETFCK